MCLRYPQRGLLHGIRNYGLLLKPKGSLMKRITNTLRASGLIGVLCLTALPMRAAEPLLADKPILIPGAKGGFDFLEVDAAKRRLLACHAGNGTLDVFKLDTGQLIRIVPTGKAQDVAVDGEAGKYYVGVSREQIVAIVDSKTLAKTGEIKIPGPSDAVAFDPKSRCLYVDNDDGTRVFVIDMKTEKITATITIPEAPEYVAYDAVSDRIFQNIKSSDQILVIDPASNTVRDRWQTAPALKPHGLAFDAASHRLFIAGNNGKLAVMDSEDGKVIATVDIAAGVDQIVFDAGNKRVYCAASAGVISVVQETEDGAKLLGHVTTGVKAHTLTVDPETHAVWIAYGDKESSHILRFSAQ